MGWGAYSKETFAEYEIVVSEEQLHQSSENVIKLGWAYVLEVAGVLEGCVLGSTTASIYSNDLIFGTLLFFVSPSKRNLSRSFLKEVERQVKARGCTKFVIANSMVNNGETLDRFYRIMGYKKLEVHYMRSL